MFFNLFRIEVHLKTFQLTFGMKSLYSLLNSCPPYLGSWCTELNNSNNSSTFHITL